MILGLTKSGAGEDVLELNLRHNERRIHDSFISKGAGSSHSFFVDRRPESIYVTFETNTYGFVKILPDRNSRQALVKEKTPIINSKQRYNIDPFTLRTVGFSFSAGKVRICQICAS